MEPKTWFQSEAKALRQMAEGFRRGPKKDHRDRIKSSGKKGKKKNLKMGARKRTLAQSLRQKVAITSIREEGTLAY